jgi:WD40 repeat protein
MDGTARVFDAASGKQLLVLQHPVYLMTVNWAPDSQRVVTTGGDGVSRIWDAQTGKLVQEHSESTKSVTFAAGWSPDGSRIATSYWPADIVEVWNVATSETLFTLGDGTCDMHIPRWSPQGDRLATGCWYTTADDDLPASIWDSKTGQLLMTLESHDGETMKTAWSPDGARLAVSYGKGPVKVWDAATGEELLTFNGHNQPVWEATWSPDGRRIASGDQAGNVKVWEANTGQEVMIFKAPGFVRSLDWSDDGQYLLVSGMFTTPFIKRVWQSTDELIQYVKECCVLRELTLAERQQFGLAVK